MNRFQSLRARLPHGFDKRYNIYSIVGAFAYRKVYGTYGICFYTFMLISCIDLLNSKSETSNCTINRINYFFKGLITSRTIYNKINWLLDNDYIGSEKYGKGKNGGPVPRRFYLTHLGKSVIKVYNDVCNNRINEINYKD